MREVNDPGVADDVALPAGNFEDKLVNITIQREVEKMMSNMSLPLWR